MNNNTAKQLNASGKERRPAKANFDYIYDRADPRGYFTELARYDYRIPDYVQTAFGGLLAERARRDGRPPRVFDIACSYGINSALIGYRGVSFWGLAQRYRCEQFQAMTCAEVEEAERGFFAERALHERPLFYGCDVAANAVRYGERVGLLERGFAIDLETHEPSRELIDTLAGVDVVTVSAAIGYISYRSIDAILRHIPGANRPWFAAFALRTAPMDEVGHNLRQHDLTLATLCGVAVPQRRFVGEQERRDAIARLRARGYVVTGLEAEGYCHAQFYLGMPTDDDPLRMAGLLEL